MVLFRYADGVLQITGWGLIVIWAVGCFLLKLAGRGDD